MATYRLKDYQVEATQFDPTRGIPQKVVELPGGHYLIFGGDDPEEPFITGMRIEAGDWIVTNADGMTAKMKDEDFRAKFDMSPVVKPS